jgi:flavin-dependent dehydrogenase
MNGVDRTPPVVAAQEIEVPVDEEPSGFGADPERPELYFTSALDGYGWCFRKGRYVNVGFGRVGTHGVPRAAAAFADFLKARRRIPADASWQWRGHAYRLAAARPRRLTDDAVVLAGDAAGLAHPLSGEGIRPAIESGLLAASAIIDANGRYTHDRLRAYERRVRRRFGVHASTSLLARAIPAGAPAALAPRLFESRWFVRHVLLDRWFLRTGEAAIS